MTLAHLVSAPSCVVGCCSQQSACMTMPLAWVGVCDCEQGCSSSAVTGIGKPLCKSAPAIDELVTTSMNKLRCIKYRTILRFKVMVHCWHPCRILRNSVHTVSRSTKVDVGAPPDDGSRKARFRTLGRGTSSLRPMSTGTQSASHLQGLVPFGLDIQPFDLA